MASGVCMWTSIKHRAIRHITRAITPHGKQMSVGYQNTSLFNYDSFPYSSEINGSGHF